MGKPFILSLDQGTSATKAIAVAVDGSVIARGQAAVPLKTRQPGWVEHDSTALLTSVREALFDLGAKVDLHDATCLGISNQRESVLLWDPRSGEPISSVISWQDRRTVDMSTELSWAAEEVRAISGLPLDPMFSALKARWLLDAHDPDRTRARAGELILGTIDSWLLFALTGEISIESGNASRTSLVDLATGDWSPRLLEIFDVPLPALPRITPSVGKMGVVRNFAPLPDAIAVTGILGDSHAALFAHAGWLPGVVKATYGTGSSVMAVGAETSGLDSGLCRTIAWQLPENPPAIAWEANILSAGSTVAWLAGMLGCTPQELADVAAPSSAGVVFVPAFNGLAAPWWDTGAQAQLGGLSLSTTRAELARAALDSVIFQVCDVISAMRDSLCEPTRLIADGGISANMTLMQRQSALCDVTVDVSLVAEASALGAAHAAGLGIEVWDLSALEALPRDYVECRGVIEADDRAILLDEWHQALERARSR